MRGALIVITGTGTGIGKTHIACALLLAARSRSAATRVLGYKPVESGVDGASETDAARLANVSTFHVKQFPSLQLHAPLSPHLAAEIEHASLDWDSVVRFVDATRDAGVHVLVELPGGLFTPLTAKARNVDVIASLAPTTTLLLAPDRLGVLHDVGASLAGATHVGARIDLVGLVACEIPDTSATRNARELARFTSAPIVGTWSRDTPSSLADVDATIRVVYTYWLSRSG